MPGKGTIIERNGKFYLKISINEDGRYRQKWLPLKAKDRGQAEKEQAKIWADREREQWKEPKKVTVDEVFERWIKHLRNRPKPAGRRTIEEYQKIYKNHIKEELGHIQLQKLTAKMVRELIESKDSQFKARRTYDVLHAMIELAYRDGDTGIKENVCKRLKEKPKIERVEQRTWNAEQCKKFLAELQEHRYYGVFLCAMTTGMRIGEVLGLRWQDVDMRNRIIYVNQKLEFKEPGNPEIKIGPPKTKASEAPIPMTEILYQELKRIQERQRFEKSGYREDFLEYDFVFKNMKGGPVSLEYLRKKVMWKVIEKTGLPKIRIHDLRHSAATLLRSMGFDIKTIQRYLRHADLSATQIYTHDEGVEFLREATEKMNEALSR